MPSAALEQADRKPLRLEPLLRSRPTRNSGLVFEEPLSHERLKIERQLCLLMDDGFGHPAGHHEQLLCGVGLERRKADSGEHPLWGLKRVQPGS